NDPQNSQAGSYVVVPWPSPSFTSALATAGVYGVAGSFGMGNAGSGGDGTGEAGLAEGGLMQSFSPPSPPPVPTLHQVISSSGPLWIMNDGGTVVYSTSGSQTNPDGSVLTRRLVDTVTFQITQTIDYGTSGATSVSIVRQDQISLWEHLSAA